MRSRLVALIAVPTLIAVILGGVRLVSGAGSALGYDRVLAMANLGGTITALAQALEDERDTMAGYVAAGRPPGAAGAVQRDEAYSVRLAQQAGSGARGIGTGYPAGTRAQAAAVLTGLGGLNAVRAAATNGQRPALGVVQDYSRTIDRLIALDDDIGQVSGDSTLSGTVRALGLVSRMKEEASQQRGILSAALTRGQFAAGELAALQAARAQQDNDLAIFNTSATAAQRDLYLGAVTGSRVSLAGNEEQNAISLAGSSPRGSLSGASTTAGAWNGAMSGVVSGMRSVESNLMRAAISRSATLRNNAITGAVAGTAAVVLVLLISFVFTSRIVRSMVGPLRELRAGALEVAGVRLPEIVRRLRNSEDGELPADVEPIHVDSADEIGEVARAFDQVHREALRLAANEALLRSSVNSMFVNLSRRTQSLVERQLEVIDGLEQGEADPQRLDSLFRMDHLATRMRRNSENLLVLAGHEGVWRWKRPAALLDVLRAAMSEIEQYARVQLDVQPGAAVRGPAVGDVVHLVAELAENATAFSPAETPVTVSGRMQTDGVVLEITDHGIGMSAEEIAQANSRLEHPPVVDAEVSRRMGLFVVGRLAARHGITVRLGPSPEGGLSAVIWVPEQLIVREPPSSMPGPARHRADGTDPAGMPAAAGTAGRADAAGLSGAGLSGAGLSRAGLSDAGDFPDSAVLSGAAGTAGAARPVPSVPAPFDWPLPAHVKIAPAGAAGGAQRDPVIDPSGGHQGGNRLPIFESVESAWFRGESASGSSGHSDAGMNPVSGPGRTEARDEGNWTSPADEGWRAAKTVRAPVADGTTEAGLPKRTPQANLVPGNAGGLRASGTGGGRPAAAPEPAPAGAVRSAQEIRERLSGFQRGARAGHAAGRSGELAAGEEWEGNA